MPPIFSRPGVRGMSPDAGRQRLEDRIEMPHGRLRSADHHAVAALQAPDAAAGADIHIVMPFGASSLARRMSST